MRKKIISLIMIMFISFLSTNNVKAADNLNIYITENEAQGIDSSGKYMPILKATLYYNVGSEYIKINESAYITNSDYYKAIYGGDKKYFINPFDTSNTKANVSSCTTINNLNTRKDKLLENFENLIKQNFNESKINIDSEFKQSNLKNSIPESKISFISAEYKKIQNEYKDVQEQIKKYKTSDDYKKCEIAKITKVLNESMRTNTDLETKYRSISNPSVNANYYKIANLLSVMVCTGKSSCNYSDELVAYGQMIKNYILMVEPGYMLGSMFRSVCDNNITAGTGEICTSGGLSSSRYGGIKSFIFPRIKYTETLSTTDRLTCVNTDKNNEAEYSSKINQSSVSYPTIIKNTDEFSKFISEYNKEISSYGLRDGNNYICNTFCKKTIKFSFPGNVGDLIVRGTFFEWPTTEKSDKNIYPISITYEKACEVTGIPKTKKFKRKGSCPDGTTPSAYGCISKTTTELVDKVCPTGWGYNPLTGYCETPAYNWPTPSSDTKNPCPSNYIIGNGGDNCYATKESQFKCKKGEKVCEDVKFKSGTAKKCRCQVTECSKKKSSTTSYYYNGSYFGSLCGNAGGTLVDPKYDRVTGRSYPCGTDSTGKAAGTSNCCRFTSITTSDKCVNDTHYSEPECKKSGYTATKAPLGKKKYADDVQYYCSATKPQAPPTGEYVCGDKQVSYYDLEGNLKCVDESNFTNSSLSYNGDDYVFITIPTCGQGTVDYGNGQCIKIYNKIPGGTDCPTGYKVTSNGECELDCDINDLSKGGVEVSNTLYDNLRISGGTKNELKQKVLNPVDAKEEKNTDIVKVTEKVENNKKTVTTTVKYSLNEYINRYFNRVTNAVTDTNPGGVDIVDRGKGVISTSMLDQVAIDGIFKKYPLTLTITKKEGGKSYCNPDGTFEEKVACLVNANPNDKKTTDYTCYYKLKPEVGGGNNCNRYNNNGKVEVSEEKIQECIATGKDRNACIKELCPDPPNSNICTGDYKADTKFTIDKDGNKVGYTIQTCNNKICSFELTCHDNNKNVSAGARVIVLSNMELDPNYIDYSSSKMNEKNIKKAISKTTVCLSSKTSFAVFRQVSLNNPFPNRKPKSNWSSEVLREAKLTKARGASGDKLYQKDPIISITLSPNDIKKIKEYNIEHKDYSDFTLNCAVDDSYCLANAFRDYMKANNIKITYSNSNCNLTTSSTLEDFNKCYNSTN